MKGKAIGQASQAKPSKAVNQRIGPAQSALLSARVCVCRYSSPYIHRLAGGKVFELWQKRSVEEVGVSSAYF